NPGFVSMLSAHPSQSFLVVIPIAYLADPPIVSIFSLPTRSFIFDVYVVCTLADPPTLPVALPSSSSVLPPRDSYLAFATASNSSLVILDASFDRTKNSALPPTIILRTRWVPYSWINSLGSPCSRAVLNSSLSCDLSFSLPPSITSRVAEWAKEILV